MTQDHRITNNDQFYRFAVFLKLVKTKKPTLRMGFCVITNFAILVFKKDGDFFGFLEKPPRANTLIEERIKVSILKKNKYILQH